jgi:hypothetical protein
MHVVLERVVGQIASEIQALDADTAQLHPGGRTYKWTTQQIIEHLVLSYRLANAALETRLNKGRPARKQKRTYLQWSLQLMVLSFGNLPQGVPALEETTPVPGAFEAMNGRQLGDFLRQEAEAMDTLLDSSRRKFGMEGVAAHPWLGALRVDQWRRFHVVHGLHHLDQLRSVKEQVAPAPLPVKLTGMSLVKKVPVNGSLLES